MLASLNHPNIAAIHGLEESEGTRALVLELVEGPTLADRIALGPIPLDEALPIAKQIAEALEAAHEAGVIHRDLKPANIKVRDDGTVKVLDFGLAKGLDTTPQGDPSQSPTLTAAATQMGVIMGTAAYMSPEQARGKAVDKRADIWSFGVVLYEMLAGRRAFDSEDLSLTLADVMRADPAWDRLPSDLSPSLVTYLKRCLQKDPRDRVRDIGDVRLALGGAFESNEPSASTYNEPVPHSPGVPPWRRMLRSSSLAIVLAGLVGLTVWVMMRPEPGAVVRFAIATTPETSLRLAGFQQLAIAPDGSVAYGSSEGIYLRRVGEVDPTPVQGVEAAFGPFFSPDGRSLGFFGRNDTLNQVSVLGGEPSAIAVASDHYVGASWGPDNSIVLGSNSQGLARVSATGGTLEPLTQVGAEGESHRWPSVLPNGRGVLFTVWSGDRDTARIAVLSLETGEVTDLVMGGTSPRYSPTGHLVYAAGATLRAVGFDADQLTVSSDAALPVLENVLVTADGVSYFGIADTGTLVYFSSSATSGSVTLALVDPTGQAQVIGVPGAGYNYPRVSPDGDQVAYMAEYTDGADIALYEIGSDTAPLRLTFGGGNRYPVWSADGRRIMFQSDRDGLPGIFSRSIDGAGAAEPLTTPTEGERHVPDSASSDGAWSVVHRRPRPGIGGVATRARRRRRRTTGRHAGGAGCTIGVFSRRAMAGVSVRRNWPRRDLRTTVSADWGQVSGARNE